MKDTESLHKKVQELCDCYSTTDLLKEMSRINSDENGLESALKYLALIALHGINYDAEKITIKQSNDGKVSVVAEYREAELPAPNARVGENIFEAIREIIHVDDKKGKSTLALGIKDSSIDLNVSVKEKTDYKKVSIKFP